MLISWLKTYNMHYLFKGSGSLANTNYRGLTCWTNQDLLSLDTDSLVLVYTSCNIASYIIMVRQFWPVLIMFISYLPSFNLIWYTCIIMIQMHDITVTTGMIGKLLIQNCYMKTLCINHVSLHLIYYSLIL